MTTSNHQTWPTCFRAHTRLRDLAPAEGMFRAFYGAFHLFQIDDQSYTVVDTCHGQRFGPYPMAEICACYPGLAMALRCRSRRSSTRRCARGGAANPAPIGPARTTTRRRSITAGRARRHSALRAGVDEEEV